MTYTMKQVEGGYKSAEGADAFCLFPQRNETAKEIVGGGIN